MEIKNLVENLNRILDTAEDSIRLENQKADLKEASRMQQNVSQKWQMHRRG